MAGISETDEVVAGSTDSDDVYVSSDLSAIPQEIVKVNVVTGRRQPYVAVSPVDPAGIVGMTPPLFSGDEKRYVYTQVRELSILYVATGLK